MLYTIDCGYLNYKLTVVCLRLEKDLIYIFQIGMNRIEYDYICPFFKGNMIE